MTTEAAEIAVVSFEPFLNGGDEGKHAVAKEIYNAFQDKKTSAISEIMAQLRDSNAAPYNELSDEMQAYMDYISITILERETDLLLTDQIDTFRHLVTNMNVMANMCMLSINTVASKFRHQQLEPCMECSA